MRGAAIGLVLACFAVLACSSSDDPPVTPGGDAGAEEEGGSSSGGPSGIACGSRTCNSPTFCCARTNGMTCLGTGCSKDEEAPIRCDDDGDCESGQTCCALVFNGHLNSVGCTAECTGPGAYRRCGATTTCGSQACKDVADVAGGSIVPDAKVSVCAP